jgi:ubiquinone/menaquinone biosynthesis C-methylase UbiE
MTVSEKAVADPSAVLQFWRDRAKLGADAGTRDIIAKQLEIEAISRYVTDGMRILEAGCGNGVTALELARRHTASIVGFDYAPEMIEEAKKLSTGQQLRGNVQFHTGDIRDLEQSGGFDMVFTERVLINLDSWEKQRNAIQSLTNLLVVGGIYVMCENSSDGLESINVLRQQVNLPPVIAPWHNRYLRDEELKAIDLPNVVLEHVEYYSSTYYFLSRVVNAWLAGCENREPQYEAPVNELALALPPMGTLGQGRIWVWRKTA